MHEVKTNGNRKNEYKNNKNIKDLLGNRLS